MHDMITTEIIHIVAITPKRKPGHSYQIPIKKHTANYHYQNTKEDM